LVRGRVQGVVDKVDGFLARLKQGIQDYKEDLATIKELFTDDELRAATEKQLRFYYIKLEDKMEPHRKVIAVIAVRGTEFIS